MENKDIKNCPIRKAFQILGSKWTLLILMELKEVRRYGEVKKMIPDISEKMLIEKLRLLESYKFISRKNYNQIPPKVEYSLTKLGKEALELVPLLIKIGNKI